MTKLRIINLIMIVLALCFIYGKSYAEYWGDCQSCLHRFESDNERYVIQERHFCKKCFDIYNRDGRISLHPSGYCGVWCAHGDTSEEIDNCSHKDSPRELIKESVNSR